MKINSKNINDRIDQASDLVELAKILNEHDDGSFSLDEVTDMTSLPTFGGEEPADTWGIFSWDAHSVLVQGGEGWEIEPREDDDD